MKINRDNVIQFGNATINNLKFVKAPQIVINDLENSINNYLNDNNQLDNLIKKIKSYIFGYITHNIKYY